MTPHQGFVAASELINVTNKSIDENHESYTTSTDKGVMSQRENMSAIEGEATVAPQSSAVSAVMIPHSHADELLIRVLQWLEPVDLSRCREVCRQWRISADSNLIWRQLCVRRWPSVMSEPVRRLILAGRGYRAYFIASSLRPRSTLADFVFTVDVTATSYQVLPYTEAIGGISFSGADVVPAADLNDTPEARRFVASFKKPWQFTAEPYAFRTLGDLVNKASGEAPPSAPCHPELRLQVGAFHRTEFKHSQLATLAEGRDLRTTVWYRDRGSAKIGDSNTNDIDTLTPPSSPHTCGHRRAPPETSVELDFTGTVTLPTHLGGIDRQILDVSLRGSVSTRENGARKYTINHVIFGPLFNLNDGPTPATAADIAECLDLKLGLFTEARGVAQGVY